MALVTPSTQTSLGSLGRPNQSLFSVRLAGAQPRYGLRAGGYVAEPPPIVKGTPAVPAGPGQPYIGFTPDGLVKAQYAPYPRPSPQEAQAERLRNLEEALLREQLTQMRLGGAGPGGVGGGAGVPRTTRTSTEALLEAAGAAPSISEIRRATELIQPTPPAAPGLPATVPAPSPADNAAAVAAAYGRAKDAIAAEAAAARRAAQANLTRRGVSGTGLEAQVERDLTRTSLAQLGEVARQLAAQDVARADQFAQLGYQGGITQRGQDLSGLLNLYQAQLGLLPNPVAYIAPLMALRAAGGALY